MTFLIRPVISGAAYTWSRTETIQLFTVILVLFAVSLSVFIWAAFFRKPRRHHHHHHHHRYPPPPSDIPSQQRTAEKVSSAPRRRRVRRHEHRPRNPTLAEAGGLPPERVDEVEPPAAPAP